MRRIGMGLLTLLLLVPSAWAADDKKDKDKEPPDKKAATPAEEYQAILKDYQQKQQEFSKAYQAAKDDAERQKAFEKYPQPQQFAARMQKLAEANAKSDVGLDAAAWLVQQVRSGPASDKGLEILAENHVQNAKIGQICTALIYSQSPKAEKLLRDVLEKNKDHKAQGNAAYALASYLKNHAQRADEGNPVGKEAEDLLERVAKEFADVNLYGNRSLADAAKGDLFEIRNLAVGKEAPDIEGKDADQKPFKLSDYRGKVVVLDFWGNW
jgi:AhpC/TSA family